jgi:ribosome-binding factor A
LAAFAAKVVVVNRNQNRGFARSERVSEQIKRELADLLQFEVKDPRVRFVSITDIELTPDYAHAKVFFTSLQPAEKLPEIKRGLQTAAGFLRRELQKRIRLHTTPELHFHYDNSIERGASLSQLIDQANALSDLSDNESDTSDPSSLPDDKS